MRSNSNSSVSAIGRILVIVFGSVACSSCSSKGVPLYPIHGRIMLDGKPMSGGLVILHPFEEVGLNGFKPRALADADGWFKIYTHAIGDGAPAGLYAVTIQPKRPKQDNSTAKSKGAKRQAAQASAKLAEAAGQPPATRIHKSDKAPKSQKKKEKARERDASCPARYRDPKTSGLRIEVKQGDNELPPFELESTDKEPTP